MILVNKTVKIKGKCRDILKVICCGIQTILYKREEYQYCHRCGKQYDFNGGEIDMQAIREEKFAEKLAEWSKK